MPKHIPPEVDRKKNLALRSLFFVAGFACALLLLLITSHAGQSNCNRPLISNKYKFIASSQPCYGKDTLSQHYDTGLKSEVQKYIDEAKTRKITKHVSVYHYDFRDQSWFGINENEKFYPASLLKLPILIAAMKQYEDAPEFFSRKIKYTGTDAGYTQYYKPSERLVTGKVYTIADLVEKMIMYSNNEASFALLELLGEDNVLSVYADVEAPLPTTIGAKFITVQEYASFYKILFNSAYLSRKSSEAALGLLTQTEFKEGIVKGVPSKIVVAHKFGERIEENDAAYKYQLHDCGIVYVPQKPYILCVMTRGDSFDQLAEIIKNISAIVYENASKD